VINAEQVLKLPALWDLTVMPKALEEMLSLLDRSSVGAGADIVVDLGPVERFDSAGLAALLELQRPASASGSKLRWQAMPKNLHELARVYGFDNGLPRRAKRPRAIIWKVGRNKAPRVQRRFQPSSMASAWRSGSRVVPGDSTQSDCKVLWCVTRA
jgi:ABC-type transporter Mla MlaB component